MYVYLLVDLSESVCWAGYSKIMICIVEFIARALWKSSCRIDYAELVLFHGEFEGYIHRVSKVGSRDDILNEFPRKMRRFIEESGGASSDVCGWHSPIISAVLRVVNVAPSGSLIVLVSDLEASKFDEGETFELARKLKEKNVELVLVPLVKDKLRYSDSIKSIRRFLEHYISERVPDPDRGELLKKLQNLDFRNVTELVPLIIRIPGLYVVENYGLIENIKGSCAGNANPVDCCIRFSEIIVPSIERTLNAVCSRIQVKA